MQDMHSVDISINTRASDTSLEGEKHALMVNVAKKKTSAKLLLPNGVWTTAITTKR